MSDSFQKEIPKARVNITLELTTDGARRKKELPLKLLAVGNFSHANVAVPLVERERINVNRDNFDQVLQALNPHLTLNIANALQQDAGEMTVHLQFQRFKDFQPEQLVKQIPMLNNLLSMRNLLKDLKANLLDNHAFRGELEKLLKNSQRRQQLQVELQQWAPLQHAERESL